MTDPELIELAKSVFHDCHSIAGFGRQCDDAGRRSGLADAKAVVEKHMKSYRACNREIRSRPDYDEDGSTGDEAGMVEGFAQVLEDASRAIDRLGGKP